MDLETRQTRLGTLALPRLRRVTAWSQALGHCLGSRRMMAFAALACPECWQPMARAVPGSGRGSQKQALDGAGSPAGQLGTHRVGLFSDSPGNGHGTSGSRDPMNLDDLATSCCPLRSILKGSRVPDNGDPTLPFSSSLPCVCHTVPSL